MIQQIEHLIKTDQESQERFNELKAEYNSQKKANLSRARKTAVVLAAATVISTLFLVYAFIVKSESDRMIGEIEQLESRLEDCN